MAHATGTRLGRFKVLSQLGAEGIGEAYLAEDTHLGHKVALKLLYSELTKNIDRLRRFEQEACAASALNHPSTHTIHEVGEADHILFIATDCIDGVTLLRQMAHARMKLSEVLDISIQIAGALAAAHAAGFVHRDIKPKNVMIRRDGIAKVLDFGLAKLTEQQVTAVETTAPTKPLVNIEPGAVMGSAQYTSRTI